MGELPGDRLGGHEYVGETAVRIQFGATAIGTGICADLRFRHTATTVLAEITDLPITAASDPVAAVTDTSSYIEASAVLKNLAVHLKKAADDLRLLNSGRVADSEISRFLRGRQAPRSCPARSIR